MNLVARVGVPRAARHTFTAIERERSHVIDYISCIITRSVGSRERSRPEILPAIDSHLQAAGCSIQLRCRLSRRYNHLCEVHRHKRTRGRGQLTTVGYKRIDGLVSGTGLMQQVGGRYPSPVGVVVPVGVAVCRCPFLIFGHNLERENMLSEAGAQFLSRLAAGRERWHSILTE